MFQFLLKMLVKNELPNLSDLGLVELMNLFLAIPRKLTYLTVTEMKL